MYFGFVGINMKTESLVSSMRYFTRIFSCVCFMAVARTRKNALIVFSIVGGLDASAVKIWAAR